MQIDSAMQCTLGFKLLNIDLDPKLTDSMSKSMFATCSTNAGCPVMCKVAKDNWLQYYMSSKRENGRCADLGGHDIST